MCWKSLSDISKIKHFIFPEKYKHIFYSTKLVFFRQLIHLKKLAFFSDNYEFFFPTKSRNFVIEWPRSLHFTLLNYVKICWKKCKRQRSIFFLLDKSPSWKFCTIKTQWNFELPYKDFIDNDFSFSLYSYQLLVWQCLLALTNFIL